MDEIQPALTAKEWAARRFQFETWGEAHAHSDGALTVRDTVNQPAILRGEERQKLAALALHGQPFGFAWEDIDLLRSQAETERLEGVAPHNEIRAEALDALAARIAALLPP